MNIGYLEIVTPDVAGTCSALEGVHGASFSDPVPALGGARTAPLEGGGRLGVRAPMHEQEAPVVRPYFTVDDAEAAVAAAEAEGAEVLHPALELPGEGTFAIYLKGEAQLGVWVD
ncbi:hydroxylase [Planctomycetota bacterium]|jgi:predicted enzyme related to lactoylglutathione lyase|nr:hydroxylase [Planctomycetota bacterium]